MPRGLLFILSSPSGAGKTSVCQGVLATDGQLRLSISATTRAPRPLEREGKDYFFLSPEAFHAEQKKGAFLETAHVFGHWYGTPREAVEKELEKGHDVLFDVDWQGARSIAQKWGYGVVRIFLLPPSLHALEERLQNRGQDAQAVVQQRMSRALAEMSHWAEYDYVVVNHELAATVRSVQHIIGAERLKRAHQTDLCDWLAEMTPSEAAAG